MSANSSTPQTVIVLGAGVAGLGAARALRDAGIAVTVIEARDRIGGRTHTSHLWPDLPVDMGASWIHGTTGNPLSALAKELGVKTTPTSYQRSVTYDESGGRIDFHAAVTRAFGIMDIARGRAERLPKDVSLQAAIEAAPEWQALSDTERRTIRLAINTRIEHEYAGDWSLLSAWHFDDGTDFPGDESVVTPGIGPIAAHLAQGLDIRLGEPAIAIAPRGAGVEVITPRGRHRADRVIVTLPIGVLQSGSVQFAEPLADMRQDAVDGLGMGLLNKCVLRFDRAFWPDNVDWIDFCGPILNLWADWTSYLSATGQPLLVGFNAGAMADQVEAMNDHDTAASATEALRAMFGTSVAMPRASQISRWRQDRFARGAYSFNGVGTSWRDRSALFGADWDGRLFFAGEATSSKHPGTVHGALLTGRAVAKMIVRQAMKAD